MLAIDPNTNTSIANIRMHSIGKIDRRSISRQGNQAAFRGEAEHLIPIHLKLRVFQKLLWGVCPIKNIAQIIEPVKAFDITWVNLGFAGFISPMGGDAILGETMHGFGPNLYLNLFLIWANNSRM